MDYVRDVKPLLTPAVLRLPRGAEAEGGAAARHRGPRSATGGDGGPAVVAGKSAESLLIDGRHRRRGLADAPGRRGEPLSAEEIARLKAWIDAGAQARRRDGARPTPATHWAFQPPVRPAVPEVKDAAWVRNPIDAFLAAEHERAG